MRTFVAALLLVSAIGCSKHSDEGTTDPLDPWVRYPPVELLGDAQWRELPPEAFAVVTVDEAKALAKLESTPWVKLTAEEAEHFFGRPFPVLNGQLVLLRALALNELNGGYSLMLRLDSVWVRHGSLGNQPVPVKRRALVARLPSLPSEVYVDCGMAE